MTKQLLFIQGGGEGAYDADVKLAAHLQEVLGSGYEVCFPRMPEEDKPDYAAWKEQIIQYIASRDGEVLLVGHSLGASFLLKYLSEVDTANRIAGVFLVASPYWGAEDWEVEEYALNEQFASKLSKVHPLFFYHSRDDEWVPFAHLSLYAEKLPHAVIRPFDGRGHQFNNDMTEVAQDIISSDIISSDIDGY
ncbi:RBBP9/YdeN family alpha/beta hydrolase [Cohnella herbarum]|uniref:Alpha/beta fold hydrolase n=1 Tax=Cohnella herbarum TaxID=2728023 RepID=A0A7Z2VP85_9BACL|nr:alpha/beta fold hydrolase [Cohnella herbarum]QJD86564.1 alpha/beta fold hydrolase [Cohnella herbarum]